MGAEGNGSAQPGAWAACDHAAAQAVAKAKAKPVSKGLPWVSQLAMALQASAQSLQASAHFLQCSMSCFAHSLAHAWQAWAHNAQIASRCAPWRAMEAAARRHMSAHSKSNSMQRTIGFG